MKKILVLNGSPKNGGLTGALSQQYASVAKEAGFSVSRVNLGELTFDPNLASGYDVITPLEPDLIRLQAQIQEADHLVMAYPVWWGGVPALMKGALDRTLLPGFAFRFEKGASFPQPLLAGKTARLLVTMDTPPWYYNLVYGAPSHKMMKKTVLEFCGVKPVKISAFGPVIKSTQTLRQRWLQQTASLAMNGD
ncbi:NAD(P)H-dependent oxidoreductase [Hahella sp. HN01]|uniref:NAD(P)H-dependent oxidoreductase n=1 Tax=Hahella sp. HN01 TaxID=2847262 RepID=UPI001C1EB85F|nr:NAD(P)H-dependent oxidoreductase [Hahella sp. HN01]MBU6955385.1 NAD(P)H-dependent oxidoreductase [Hahella sp. HN01]